MAEILDLYRELALFVKKQLTKRHMSRVNKEDNHILYIKTIRHAGGDMRK